MEVFSRYSTVGIKPMFCITPKPFNAIYMIPSFRSTQVLSDHYMITSDSQRSISMPVISVIQTSRPGALSNMPYKLSSGTSLHRESLDQSVPLQNPEYDNFACGSPTTFSLSSATKGRFIAFNASFKRYPAMFFKGAATSNQSKKTFNCRSRCNTSETHAINRNSEGEKFNKLSFCSVRKPAAFPDRFNPKPIATPTTFYSAIRKFPIFRVLAFYTSYHS